MDPIEKAIREAFKKGDVSSNEYRLRVYESAGKALQRALANNTSITPEAATIREKKLARLIQHIEAEFSGAPIPAAPQVQADEQVAPPVTSAEPIQTPSNGNPESTTHVQAERRPEKTASAAGYFWRRRFAVLFTLAMIAAFVIIGIWWVISVNFSAPSLSQNQSVPNPGNERSENFIPLSEGGRDTSDWLEIFNPVDLTSARVPAGITAQTAGSGKDGYMQLSANAGNNEEVAFEIGQGIIEQLAGSSAKFNITARSAVDASAQLSVRCVFDQVDVCKRRRFEIGSEKQDLLFELDLSQVPTSAEGTLLINPDINVSGKPIQIYGIAAQPSSVGGGS